MVDYLVIVKYGFWACSVVLLVLLFLLLRHAGRYSQRSYGRSTKLLMFYSAKELRSAQYFRHQQYLYRLRHNELVALFWIVAAIWIVAGSLSWGVVVM